MAITTLDAPFFSDDSPFPVRKCGSQLLLGSMWRSDGRRVRVLAIVDDYTRECLALVAVPSLSGLRVARELDIVIRLRGRPETIVSDNGTEFTSTCAGGARRSASRGTT